MGETARPVPGPLDLLGMNQEDEAGPGVKGSDVVAHTVGAGPMARCAVLPVSVHAPILPEAAPRFKTDSPCRAFFIPVEVWLNRSEPVDVLIREMEEQVAFIGSWQI